MSRNSNSDHHNSHEDPADDPIDQMLGRVRPMGDPNPDVRHRHRSDLRAAIGAAEAPRWRRLGPQPAMVAAVALLVVAVAGAVLAFQRDDPAVQVSVMGTPGDGDVGPVGGSSPEPGSSPQPDPPGPVALFSDACAGALPFGVPLDESYGLPVAGPAPGAPGSDVDGQLVAHWAGSTTAIEVRWPADVSTSMLAGLGQTRDDIVGAVGRGVSAVGYTEADLGIQIVDRPDGTEAGLVLVGRRDRPTDSYKMTVGGYLAPSIEAVRSGESDGSPAATWGEGMCSIVQITAVALNGHDNVLADAEMLYEDLVAPGGPLVPAVEIPPLVVARSVTDELAPPTQCEGNPANPVKYEPVDGPGPHPTADEALAAYLATRVAIYDGPFGPREERTAAEGGYTAHELPDGRVAYQWPASGVMIGYYFAEQGSDGWSITSIEGPSC